MAFTAETFSDVTPFGGFIFHPRKYKSLLSGIAVIGAGLAASTWLIAAVATMQTMVVPLGGNELTQVSFPLKLSAPVVQHDRVIHAAKSFRLSSSATMALTAEAVHNHGLKVAAAQPRDTQWVLARTARVAAPTVDTATTEAKAPPSQQVAQVLPTSDAKTLSLIPNSGAAKTPAAPLHATEVAALAPAEIKAFAEKAMPAIGLASAADAKSSALTAAAKPAPQPAREALEIGKLTKDDAVAPALVAKAAVIVDNVDRIIIPPKSVVEAAGQPIILALAAPAPVAESRPIAVPSPNLRPAAAPQSATLTVASVAPASTGREVAALSPKPDVTPVTNTTQTAEASPDGPFGLVLAEQSDDAVVPLPMARPAGIPKITAPGTDRNTRPAEPVLAYAKTDDDDNNDEIPTVKKPFRVPAARNGVAIYDISAGAVYLPSGERLEAHSGLGKMRDNPRYIDQKNRGPTPPHTYDLTMRESLFHGVEAIRLTPVEGADAIFGRVGLLAHTYMLGRAGDSNGCVSFKDYRRFLAAYKRGEIKRLTVVTKLSGAPATSPSTTPTLASLFSSRS